MSQGVLPFKYEEEKNDTGMTALAGLPGYLDPAKVIGIPPESGIVGILWASKLTLNTMT